MKIQFDSMSTNEFFKWIAAKFLEVSMPQIKQAVEGAYTDDELLTRKEVSERILKCDANTADKYYLYKEGFPYMDFGERGRRYPKRQVEEWIKNNTKYN